MASNEIDTLMTLDPLGLSTQDIDKIIDYFRSSYHTHEGSAKFSKTRQASDKPKMNLVEMGLLKPKAVPQISRRKI